MQDPSKQPSQEELALKRALEHPKRLEIFGYLTQEGGADEAELVAALDLTALRARYHLTVLQDAHLVVRMEGVDRGKTTSSYLAASAA